MIISIIIIGYIAIGIITAVAYAFWDDDNIVGETTGMMAYIGILWPVFAPVGLVYVTFGFGARWIYHQIQRRQQEGFEAND